MTSTPTRQARATLAQATEHIAARRPFVAGGGTMRGEVVTHMPTSVGRLHPAWKVDLGTCIAVARAAGGQTFLVWSYGTPIAWTDTNGTLTVPPVRYTTTTSKHQYAAHQAIR